MKQMKPAVLVMTIVTFVITALTLVGVILDDLHTGDAGYVPFFQTHWVGVFLSVVLGLFCLLQLACLFTTRFSLSKLGFHLFHFGIVFFLVASFIFFVSGDKSYFTLNVGTTYNSTVHFDSGDEDLGFGLQVKSLQVARYEPNESGVAADKMVSAQLMIYPNDGSAPYEKLLYINGPLTENGYKLYLMSYDRAAYDAGENQTVTILIKKNPGELLTLISVVMLIVGSFIMAFGKRAASPDAKKGGHKANARK